MTRAVLVTGGGGFVGTRLAGFLLAKDCRVRTLDLEPLDAPELAGRVDHLRGDIRDRALLQRAASGCDLVVHAAAALPLWPPEEIRSVNVDGTAAVVEACAALGIPRLVNISTTAVYGMPDREGLLETDALAGSDPYSRSKIQAEEIAARFRDRLCVPTLRAKLIAGPGRLGIFDVIFDWVRRGKHVPIIGAGNNPYQMLHVDDLCDAVWAAAMAPAEAANDTFNIAAARFETVREDYQGLLRHVGHGRRVIGIPALPLVLLLRLLDFLRVSPLSPSIISAAGKKSSVSIEKAKVRLGWTPRRSNLDALVDAFEWYVKHHRDFEGKAGVTHRRPLNQGILSIVRAFF
jgi:nucleoside-diphosphate-sugar epimerase